MVDLLIIAAAVCFGSFVKGVTGSGLPVVAVPVIASFSDAEQAVTIMSVPGVMSNALLITRNRGDLPQTRHVLRMIAAGVVGVVGGTVVLTSISEEGTSLALAAVVLAYVAIRLIHPNWSIPAVAQRHLSAPVGFLGGVLQGATGISSPVLAPYLHALRLPRGVYVLSIAVLFQVYAVTQVVSLAIAGTYTWTLAGTGVAVVAPMWLGIVLGLRFGRSLSTRAFDRWILFVLTATAVNLLTDVLW